MSRGAVLRPRPASFDEGPAVNLHDGLTARRRTASDGDTADRSRYAGAMRLAAIDVGSNSVHMIIADVSREGHVEVIDRVKEMVRLGRRSFTTGRLTPEAMDMTVRTLAYFKRLAHFKRVGRMRAVA